MVPICILCKFYNYVDTSIYIYMRVYTYVVCICANVYSMYMYVYMHMSMYPSPLWMWWGGGVRRNSPIFRGLDLSWKLRTLVVTQSERSTFLCSYASKS